MTTDPERFVRENEARLPHTALGALGIRVVSYDPDAVACALTIDERHLQPMGLLHGGISALLAESAASIAAAASVDLTRFAVVGVDLNITHMKAKRNGTVTATARPLRRGRTVHVYAIDITDDAGALVSVSRCTVNVVPLHR